MGTREEMASRAGRALALRPMATMEEIARAAGVSRATFFRHFPSRDALTVELCTRSAELYVAAIDAAKPEDGPAADALARTLGEVAALAPTHGLLVFQPLPEVVEGQLLKRVSATEARLLALVRRGQDSGEFRADLPAEWVLTAATWLAVGAADGLRLGVIAPRDVHRLVTQTVLSAVRHQGSPR